MPTSMTSAQHTVNFSHHARQRFRERGVSRQRLLQLIEMVCRTGLGVGGGQFKLAWQGVGAVVCWGPSGLSIITCWAT